jgi:hypothetical protein
MTPPHPETSAHRIKPPGSKVTLAEYNMALAEADRLRANQQHCEACGATWLDDGNNQLACPYCRLQQMREALETITFDGLPGLEFQRGFEKFRKKARAALAASPEEE